MAKGLSGKYRAQFYLGVEYLEVFDERDDFLIVKQPGGMVLDYISRDWVRDYVSRGDWRPVGIEDREALLRARGVLV